MAKKKPKHPMTYVAVPGLPGAVIQFRTIQYNQATKSAKENKYYWGNGGKIWIRGYLHNQSTEHYFYSLEEFLEFIREHWPEEIVQAFIDKFI